MVWRGFAVRGRDDIQRVHSGHTWTIALAVVVVVAVPVFAEPDGQELFPIGFYKLPGDEAGLCVMAGADAPTAPARPA